MRCMLIYVLMTIAVVGGSLAKDAVPPSPLPIFNDAQSIFEKSMANGDSSEIDDIEQVTNKKDCANIHLKFRENDTFSQDPNEVSVKAGETAVLHCDAFKPDGEEAMKWMKGRRTLWVNGCWLERRLPENQNRMEVLENGALQILNTTISDEGHYECRVQKSRYSKPSILRVTHQPNPRYPSKQKHVNMNNTGLFSTSSALLATATTLLVRFSGALQLRE